MSENKLFRLLQALYVMTIGLLLSPELSQTLYVKEVG